ncbi:hypothetical protein C2845_PM03G12370 [Panicum miliaceum]|uniref:Uncharacterized protein n=1 Tax=Panicum miliaceum TaxID=4540 RepID=A0A3L6TDY0_PANMI|nr:hypothetical protein C2845_PM03G12370 [Panicum miliaceum]
MAAPSREAPLTWAASASACGSWSRASSPTSSPTSSPLSRASPTCSSCRWSCSGSGLSPPPPPPSRAPSAQALRDCGSSFFAGIFAALASAPHLLVLPLEKLWHWLVATAADTAGAISSGLDGLWQHVTGFFAGIFAALASAPHLLVLPLEKLWQWLVTIVADAAGVISGGLDGLWQHVTGFFAALEGAAHQFVLPLETLWQWLATSTADAAGAISSGFDGLRQLVTGFLPGILAHLPAALAGAAHELAQRVESLWQWLLTNVADAAGDISFRLDGLWQVVAGVFPKIYAYIFAALTGAVHELPQKLDEFWRWLKAAAAVALPFVLAAAVVLLLVALVRFCGPTLCAVDMGVCVALVYAICYLGYGLYYIAVAVGRALCWLLPRCAQCLHFCAVTTMKAPDAGGMLISRAAFVAYPALYFLILHTAGPVRGLRRFLHGNRRQARCGACRRSFPRLRRGLSTNAWMSLR